MDSLVLEEINFEQLKTKQNHLPALVFFGNLFNLSETHNLICKMVVNHLIAFVKIK